MASTMTTRIAEVTKEVWPTVQAAMDQVTVRVCEIAQVAEESEKILEEYLASHQNAHRKRRAICNETVWAVARLGFLRSAADAKVIAAARELIELDHHGTDEQIDARYDALEEAVLELPSFDK